MSKKLMRGSWRKGRPSTNRSVLLYVCMFVTMCVVFASHISVCDGVVDACFVVCDNVCVVWCVWYGVCGMHMVCVVVGGVCM